MANIVMRTQKPHPPGGYKPFYSTFDLRSFPTDGIQVAQNEPGRQYEPVDSVQTKISSL